MTTPSSPPIDFGNLNGEFQQAWGSSLLTFLRAPNGVVPNVAQNAHVPQNAPLSLLDLLNATRYVPFSVNVTRSGGDDFRTEPAPIQVTVTGGLTATASGGTSTAFSYNWAYVGGGSGSLSWSTASGGRIVTASDTVRKNDIRDLVFRLTVSDGITNYQQDHTLRLTYSTDL